MNDYIGRNLNCRGANHSDCGTIVRCGQCSQLAVRLTDGRVAMLREGLRNVSYYCWVKHECNEMMVEATTVENARKVIAGEVHRGSMVVVARGRKVAKGTTGIVRVLTDGPWGERAALAVDGTEGLVWIDAKNLDAADDDEALTEARETVAAYETKHAEWEARATAAEAVFDAFQDESEEMFQAVQADPSRYEEFGPRREALIAQVRAARDDLAAVKAARGW